LENRPIGNSWQCIIKRTFPLTNDPHFIVAKSEFAVRTDLSTRCAPVEMTNLKLGFAILVQAEQKALRKARLIELIRKL
jgi:hypothetical protein